MNLQKCANGHFYDADKNGACPHCNGPQGQMEAGVTVAADAGLEMNTMLEGYEGMAGYETMVETIPGSATTIPETGINVPASSDEMKTIGFYDGVIGTEPVVGWLVCTAGVHEGEDFRLKSGRNYIGRTRQMDVVLSGEESVSREKHSIVVYEPKANKFFVLPGESTELSYLNDEVILQVTPLKAYDVITLGEVKLMFVPCCSDRFHWDKQEEKKED